MSRPLLYHNEEARHQARLRAQREYRRRHPDLLKERSRAAGLRQTERLRERRAIAGGLASASEIVGACAICQVIGPRFWDHDHATGEFRGWLCFSCNRALGGFKDNPELLSVAATYVSRRLLRVA